MTPGKVAAACSFGCGGELAAIAMCERRSPKAGLTATTRVYRKTLRGERLLRGRVKRPGT